MNERRRRILCVEDDRESASLICEELTDRGFDAAAAHNGRDALASILKDPPDLVLSDIGMPGMSGFELLARLTSMAPSVTRWGVVHWMSRSVAPPRRRRSTRATKATLEASV